MNRAKAVLPVSEYLMRQIESYGIRNRFEIVPNVVNTGIFYPPSSLNEGGRKGIKHLLLAAVLGSPKGIPYLLEALSQLREERQDFILDIVGDGPNRSEYEELTTKLGLDGIVKFHGLKTPEEVAEFMRGCDFYVQPSLWETFGIVYIEAMACGKPVVASKLPALEEIINEDTGILVPPGDVEALKSAIAYMLDNCHSYSAQKLARYARKRFSYETVARMLNEIYEDVMLRKK